MMNTVHNTWPTGTVDVVQCRLKIVQNQCISLQENDNLVTRETLYMNEYSILRENDDLVTDKYQ